MTERKKDKALALYCSIGMINDSIIAECQTPSLVKRKTTDNRWIAFAAVAACLVLIIAVVMLSNAFRPTKSNLEGILHSAESELTQIDADEVDFFSGTPNIIWQNGESGKLYTLPVNDKNAFKEINILLQKGGIELSAAEAEGISTRLWISYGDGRVVSPYLKSSAGNMAYGKLFDYTAELAPDEEWMQFIAELI